MRNKYTGEDLEGRLHGTILRYNGEPVFCRAEGDTLELSDIVTGSHKISIEPDDFLLDISSVPLGYMNSVQYKAAVYLKRHPFRRYKQGVILELLDAFLLSYGKSTKVSTSNLRCKGFVDSIKGVFPDVTTAIKALKTDTSLNSIAISRDVAFVVDQKIENIFVYIKDMAVGVYSNGVVSLPKEPVQDGIPNWISMGILNELGLKTEVDIKLQLQKVEEKDKKKFSFNSSLSAVTESSEF